MTWETKNFIDFIKLQRGYDLTKENIIPGKYPVVSSTNIMGYHDTYKVKGPGVVTGRSGTIGVVQYIEGDFWPHNTSLFVKDFNKNNPKFVYYFLKKFSFSSVGGGSAVPTLNRNNLSKIQVRIPDVITQDKIVDILSNYDLVIKKNIKQIKLLEELPQRIYKEWISNSIGSQGQFPEGWQSRPLPKIAPILTGKKDANYGGSEGEYLFFTCAQNPIKSPSFSFDCDAVILAGNGDFNVKIYRGKFEAYQRTYVLSPYESKNLFLLYFAVKSNMRQLTKQANGSTIKFLTKRMLEDITVAIPSDVVLNEFNEICECCQKTIENLRKQNKLAEEARDRLFVNFLSKEISF